MSSMSTVEHYAAFKRKEVPTDATGWRDPENLTLSKMSQLQSMRYRVTFTEAERGRLVDGATAWASFSPTSCLMGKVSDAHSCWCIRTNPLVSLLQASHPDRFDVASWLPFRSPRAVGPRGLCFHQPPRF